MTAKTEELPNWRLTTAALRLQCHVREKAAPGGTVKWEIPVHIAVDMGICSQRTSLTV